MKHANRVNTVFCIDFIPLMNVTYCFRVSLGCIRLTVCCCRIVCPARDLCLVCAHVLKLAVLPLPPLASQTALYWLFEHVQSFISIYYSIMEFSTFLCTSKYAVKVHESVFFYQVFS